MKKLMMLAYFLALCAAAAGSYFSLFDGEAGLLIIGASCFFWGVARFFDPTIIQETE